MKSVMLLFANDISLYFEAIIVAAKGSFAAAGEVAAYVCSLVLEVLNPEWAHLARVFWISSVSNCERIDDS